MLSLNDLIEARRDFNNTAGKVGSNTIRDIRSELERLVEIIEIAETKGFDDLNNKSVNLYRNAEQRKADEEEEREAVSNARAVIAKNALELLQYTIPELEALAEQMLGSTNKDAVRLVCQPTIIGYKQIPSKYQLPAEFATLGEKVKAAIGR